MLAMSTAQVFLKVFHMRPRKSLQTLLLKIQKLQLDCQPVLPMQHQPLLKPVYHQLRKIGMLLNRMQSQLQSHPALWVSRKHPVSQLHLQVQIHLSKMLVVMQWHHHLQSRCHIQKACQDPKFTLLL
jgi:hypothetical protein